MEKTAYQLGQESVLVSLGLVKLGAGSLYKELAARAAKAQNAIAAARAVGPQRDAALKKELAARAAKAQNAISEAIAQKKQNVDDITKYIKSAKP